MTLGTAIETSAAKMRIVVRIWNPSDSATIHYVGFCPFTFNDGSVERVVSGRLINCSPFTYELSESLQIPSCDIELSNSDGYYNASAIGPGWQCIIYIGAVGVAFNQWMSHVFDITDPPKINESSIGLRLENPVRRNNSTFIPVRMTDAGTSPNRFTLAQATFENCAVAQQGGVTLTNLSTLTFPTTPVYVGTNCLQTVTAVNNYSGFYLLFDPGIGSALQTYTASIYIRGNAGGEQVSYYLYDLTAGAIGAVGNIVCTTDYQRISISYTVGAVDSRSMFFACNNWTRGTIITFFCDCAQVEYGATATQWMVPVIWDKTFPSISTRDFPLYLGLQIGSFAEQFGSVEAFSDPANPDYWFFTATSEADVDITLSNSTVQVIGEFDYGRWVIPTAYWSIGFMTYTRSNATPYIWRLWYIKINFREYTGGVYRRLPKAVWLNFQDCEAVKYTRLDGATAVYKPPQALASYVATYYANGSTMFGPTSAEMQRAEDDGIQSRYFVDAKTDLVDIFAELVKDTGIRLLVDRAGNCTMRYFSNYSATITLGGYSGSLAVVDWRDCINISRDDRDVITKLLCEFNGDENEFYDSEAAAIAGIRTDTRKTENQSDCSNHSTAWRKIQENRSKTAARTITMTLSQRAFDLAAGDFILLTEQFMSLSNQPCLIESLTFDVQNLQATMRVQDLTAWSSIYPYVLVDEDSAAINRTYPARDLVVTTASGLVYWNGSLIGDVFTIAIGDVLECYTATNQYSSKFTVAPAWNGGTARWEGTVAANAQANETITYAATSTTASGYRVRRSALTADAATTAAGGFLCDTDGYYSDDTTRGHRLEL